MATRYVQQATNQLAPAYNQQVKALQSQLNPLQNLYQTLNQSLAGQQQQGNQQILEDASGRGILRSTIPVYNQGVLGSQILQQQGQYASDYAQKYADIQGQIAGVGVNRAKDISQLAQSLMSGALQQQQLAYQRQLANRQYQLDLQRAQGGF